MSTLLQIEPTRIRLADGKFDTQKRYIRAGSGTGNFPMCKGITFYPGNRDTNNYSSWRYSCAVYAMAFTALGSGPGPISLTPSYTMVKV